MRVSLADPSSGRILKRVSAANAEDLINRGIAERRSDSVIALKAARLDGRIVSPLPGFDELVADTARWAGVKKCGPELSKEKQNFLRNMKRLSA
jgi:hypothetical protein